MVRYFCFVLLMFLIGGTCQRQAEPPQIKAASISDDFCSGSKNSQWTETDPLGGSTFTYSNEYLQIDVDNGAEHDFYSSTNENGLRLMQPQDDADFTIVVKVESVPATDGEAFGILIIEDTDYNLRFDYFKTANQVRVFSAYQNGGTSVNMVNTTISYTGDAYLRISYTSSTGNYDGDSSDDGSTWDDRFDQAPASGNIEPNTVGVWAGNFNSGGIPSTVARFDYFSNEASPVNGDESSCASITPTSFRWGNLVQ